MGVSLIANGTGCQHGDHGTNPFSAAANDVIAKLVDQLDVWVELLKNRRIDSRHILRG